MRPAWVGWFRSTLAFLVLSLVAVAALRSAAVRAWADDRPSSALAAWPAHPEALLHSAFAEIGRSAAEGGAPGPGTLAKVAAAARRAPLASEPLLIAGTQALSAGRIRQAEALLLEARRRDPRAPAPRLMLADLYLRAGKVLSGLQEVAALTRLSPGGPAPAVNALAAYAREPDSDRQYTILLRQRPDLRDPILTSLAADPKMAKRVMALGGSNASGEHWQSVLVDALVRDGQFGEARAAWGRLTGDRTPANQLVNPTFNRDRAAIAPFDWTLSETAGIAEPVGRGLHVRSFGRDDGAVATQLLTLPPGGYELAFRVLAVSGEIGGVRWTISCFPAGADILQLALPDHASELTRPFVVPADCKAQKLALEVLASPFGRSTEARLDRLTLARVGQ